MLRPLKRVTMRLLLIEDDPDIQKLLSHSLTESGYSVEYAADGRSAAESLALSSYDVLVMDLDLPDQDGLDLLRTMRGTGLKTPVLILSARSSVTDRVTGLEQGADDYLTKPFAIAELIARLNNLVRSRPELEAPRKLQVQDLGIDLVRREVLRAGRTIHLTPLEFNALELLCGNVGKVVARRVILERVWGMEFEPNTNVLDVRMSRLRTKVDGAGEKQLIQTVRGIGYLIKDS